MSKSQWTVTGLLILLLGLEVVRSPNVKGFFTNALSGFQGALGGSAVSGTPGVPSSSPGATGNSNAQAQKTAPNTQPNSYPATLPDSIRNTHGRNTIG